ncbi:MAG: hypothetical protein IJ521_03280 [Schwartzia sp.]|nr:hypothetical protein [Schwartzia sp. (in: firmicutes)]
MMNMTGKAAAAAIMASVLLLTAGCDGTGKPGQTPPPATANPSTVKPAEPKPATPAAPTQTEV